MLITRVATAAILLAVCIAAMFLLRNDLWSAALLVVLGGAAWEWGTLAGYARAARWAYCAAILAAGIAVYCLAVAGSRIAGVELETLVYAAGCVFWVLIAPAWLAGRWEVKAPLAAALAGAAVLLPAWLAVARLQSDPLQLLQVLGIVWLADTVVYFTGRAWGRHKLAPAISPGKTWEGVAGAAAAVAVYYVVLSGSATALPWIIGWGGVLLFAGVTVLSIVGDLLESWVKRRAGVKDSGALLPGHGGILDRIDGLTAGMPLAALLTKHLG
jgi:phosphatidate cytidylyltransferase